MFTRTSHLPICCPCRSISRNARRSSNVYLETSSQPVSGVRKIVERAHPDRVMNGSDWPFDHQGTALAKVLIATEGLPEIRHKIL